MDMSKRYSERFKMQVAYDYFVDRCPVNALGDKYKITGDTVRYFCSERRGEYRDAIVRNWKDEENSFSKDIAAIDTALMAIKQLIHQKTTA